MIYLDNAATTRPYKEVVETITYVLSNSWGNASSAYSFGHKSKEIIESVRDQIAADINCNPEEIIFTASGCEANSFAFNSIPDDYNLLTTYMEHASILESPIQKYLIPNDEFGNINPEVLSNTLHSYITYVEKKPFVSICAANSEIGTIQDIKSISSVVHNYDGIFHCDATALYPYNQLDVQALGVDMMTVSAQKFHATEGVGFLYVKKGINIKPIIYGTQENGLRGGSYNTALIAGMGKALEITRDKTGNKYCRALRDIMLEELFKIPGVHLNGPSIDDNRLDGNINVTIDGVDASTLVGLCDMHGICISKGSACHSYTNVPSATLTSIGLTYEQALQTIRITLDIFNTYQEIKEASKILKFLINDIRKTS